MMHEVLRLDGRPRQSGDTGVDQKAGARGPSRATELVALTGHVQVANECRIASAIRTATSSGSISKAPWFCRGYLQRQFGMVARPRNQIKLPIHELYGFRMGSPNARALVEHIGNNREQFGAPMEWTATSTLVWQ